MGTTERASRIALCIVAAIAVMPSSLGAAPSPFSSSITIDWNEGIVRADVALDLGIADIRLPSGRSEADRSLETATPELVRDAMRSVALDSRQSVGESVDDGVLDPVTFEAFLGKGRRIRSSMSRDLGKLVSSYEWALADLASLYVKHSIASDLASPDRFVPTRAYSGIIVYAKGEFGVRGEHLSSGIRPCLFPRIYDEAMTPILERNLMDPGSLAAWGTVAYAKSLEDPIVSSRAGGDPLRILAAEVFGTHRTDVIISSDEAIMILASPANRELIRAGKIVFVIDMP